MLNIQCLKEMFVYWWLYWRLMLVSQSFVVTFSRVDWLNAGVRQFQASKPTFYTKEWFGFAINGNRGMLYAAATALQGKLAEQNSAHVNTNEFNTVLLTTLYKKPLLHVLLWYVGSSTYKDLLGCVVTWTLLIHYHWNDSEWIRRWHIVAVQESEHCPFKKAVCFPSINVNRN